MASVRSVLKSFERSVLRPTGRRLRQGLRKFLGESDRISQLEARVASLEGLLRELTGLAYLRLDDGQEPASSTPKTPGARSPREAA